MAYLPPPVHWFGGKHRKLSHLLPLVESIPHITYCEPFGGAASVLLNKNPSPVEVYNDIFSNVVNFFRVLRDPVKAAELTRLATLTPYSREEFEAAREFRGETDIEQAWEFLVVGGQCFGGDVAKPAPTWGRTVTETSRGKAHSTSAWESRVVALPSISKRLLDVQIEHIDGVACIEGYDRPTTLFYIDPPYFPTTRRSGQYRDEPDTQYHEKLIDVLLHIEGKAIVSNYDNPAYRQLETTYQRLEWSTVTTVPDRVKAYKAGKEATRRTEVVWVKG